MEVNDAAALDRFITGNWGEDSVPVEHDPTPFASSTGGGVRCSCGVTFAIGDKHPDTPTGKRSKAVYRTMAHCWAAYRKHWNEPT